MTPQQQNRQLPRDVFLHLLMIVVLGMTTIFLGMLLFQFINIYVPDVASTACQYDSCRSAARTAVAFLIIVFPVLVWVTRFLNRDVSANPAKRELWIRRWLLYLTLFVAGLIVIGDLIALVNGYLQGELTLRFGLKVLVVFSLASGTFYYYLNQLRHQASGWVRWLTYKVLIVVPLAIVIGFWVAGSPSKQRDVRLDMTRVNDLQTIQSFVVSFWQSKDRLPTALAELDDDILGFTVPADPESGDPYVYRRTGTLSFELCATFALENESELGVTKPLGEIDSWDHSAGRVCFERTIDPELHQLPEPVRVIR